MENENQYHSDDSINEMLSMLDNAHDIFHRKYGEDYPIVSARLEVFYREVKSVVETENPEGLKN